MFIRRRKHAPATDSINRTNRRRLEDKLRLRYIVAELCLACHAVACDIREDKYCGARGKMSRKLCRGAATSHALTSMLSPGIWRE